MHASSSFKPLFSLPDGLHYLNCAYMAPLSRRVAAAGHAALDRLGAPSRVPASDFFDPCDEVRARFARLVNVTDPQRIALIPSVSYGMATVARNTPVTAGGNLVVVEGQFPSNVHVWRRLAVERRAELRSVPAPGTDGGRAHGWNEAVLAAIDERTAVVAVPPFHWTDGSRFDLEAIGGRAPPPGAPLVRRRPPARAATSKRSAAALATAVPPSSSTARRRSAQCPSTAAAPRPTHSCVPATSG